MAPVSVDEPAFMVAEPMLSALNVALSKSRAVEAVEADEIVLAADTLVVLDGQVLGKPTNADVASDMLESLRGRAHEVLTGVALRASSGREWGAVVSSRVVMRGYDGSEIAAYIARAEPFDKAGGYAVQDAEFRPAERVEGCYLNVVGLPMCAAASGLEALGVDGLRPARRAPCLYCAEGSALVRI